MTTTQSVSIISQHNITPSSLVILFTLIVSSFLIKQNPHHCRYGKQTNNFVDERLDHCKIIGSTLTVSSKPRNHDFDGMKKHGLSSTSQALPRRAFLVLCIVVDFFVLLSFPRTSFGFSFRFRRSNYRLGELPFFATAVTEVEPFVFRGNVTILEEGEHHVVVSKPPSVVCHHSDWSGSRRGDNPQVPMLQRAREAIEERVNLVHRLDRGASGCLLMTKAASEEATSATAILQQAMADKTSQKTYVALVRGEGILKGVDFRQQGWFTVDRPIKDEGGKLNNATTHFRFLAGQDNGQGTIDRPRASLVLARPETGRWHQIRRHLNGLSHPILGDTTHGDNKVNRSWRNERDMPPERTCLHLVKLEVPPNSVCLQGIYISCPLPSDMMGMLRDHLPMVLQEAQAGLEEEGINLIDDPTSTLQIPIELQVDR